MRAKRERHSNVELRVLYPSRAACHVLEFARRGTIPMEYMAPGELRFPSGYKFAGDFVATTNEAFPIPWVSPALVNRAGGLKANGPISRPLWGSRRYVRVGLSLRAKSLSWSTSFVAVVKDAPSDVHAFLTRPVLLSIGDVLYNEETLAVAKPKASMLSSWSVDQVSQQAVLVLGNDRGLDLLDLRTIEVTVNMLKPLRAWILKDYHDFVEADLIGKLLRMACCSRFILVHDSAPGGHLTEIGVLAPLTIPIAVLSPTGRASSWMADPILQSQMRKLFHYDLATDAGALARATVAACDWAQRKRLTQAKRHERRYPWRKPERGMWKAAEPWR